MTVSMDLMKTIFSEALSKKPSASLSDIMAESLEDAISNRIIQPGQRLPAQRTLAEALGISRTAVREGLKTLEAHNLVEADARGMYRVKNVTISGLVQPLAELFAKTYNDIFYYLDASWAIERASAEISSNKVNEIDLFLMQDDISDMLRFFDSNNFTDLCTANTRFHQHLVESTGNPILIDLTEALALIYEKNFIPIRTKVLERNRNIINDHIKLYHAIKQHDTSQATQLIDHHYHDLFAAVKVLEDE